MRSYFIYNGIDSRDYNLIVSTTDDFSTSLRSYDVISVPGRNGDVYKDNLKYENVSVTYHCQIDSQKWLGFGAAFEGFRRALNACTGYCELRDSYRPEIVRQAVLATVVKPASTGPAWNIGEFDVTFSCKPQLWLADDSMDYDVTPVTQETDSSGNLLCKTGYIAVPGRPITLELVTIGSATIDSFTVTITEYSADKTYMQTTTDTLSSEFKTASVSAGEGVRYLVVKWPQNALGLDGYFKVISNGTEAIRLCSLGNAIVNDTPYDIKPVITLTRTTAAMENNIEFQIEDYVFIVKPFSGQIIIDCEAMTIASSSGTSMDSYVSVYDSYRDMAYDFPTLEPGVHMLTLLSIEDSEGSGPAVEINFSGMAVTY